MTVNFRILAVLIFGVGVPLFSPHKMHAGFVYWAEINAHVIKRANLDGSSIETVTSTIPGRTLDFDLQSGKVYATDSGSDTIARMNLDGSAFETVLSTPGTAPWGLSVDSASQQMYWSDRDTGIVYRANFDGAGVTELFSVAGSQFRDLHVDFVNEKIYVADSRFSNPGAIWRANLDGTGLEQFAGGLGSPWGIDVDPIAGKVYWTDFITNEIQRSNLDGSNAETVLSGLQPFGLDLDLSSGKMYWTEDGSSVRRANFDGTQVETLITGLNGAAGIAVVNPVPEPSSLALLSIGGLSLFGYCWRCRRKTQLPFDCRHIAQTSRPAHWSSPP